MINGYEDIILDPLRLDEFMNNYKSSYKKKSMSPLMWEGFIKEYANMLSEDPDVSVFANGGKRTIRVCPDNLTLLEAPEGTIPEPVKEIHFDEVPRLENGTPIWYDIPRPYIMCDFGWEDGERGVRSQFGIGKPSQYHMIVNGDTGSGKSVANNNMLFNMMLRYSPYDLHFYMSDAKITEFKLYPSSFEMPHIKCVAAAEDQSYVVTMLEHVVKLMNERFAIFSKYGAKNLYEFRKGTNLDMPVILVVCEEFQAMFEKTTPLEKKIVEKMLYLIGAQGRSAGVHTILVSQNLMNSIPDTIKTQATLRVALKMADDKNSVAILGNNSAAYIDKLGICYVNDKPASGKPEDDTHFRVPYQDAGKEVDLKTGEIIKEGPFHTWGKMIQRFSEKLCAEYDLESYECDFYDEQLKLTNEEHIKRLNKFAPIDNNKIFLGPKAAFTTSKNKLYEITMDTNINENIILLGATDTEIKKQWNLVKNNFDRLPVGATNKVNEQNIIVKTLDCGDVPLMEALGIYGSRYEKEIKKAKSITDTNAENLCSLTYSLSIILEADDLVFSSKPPVPTNKIKAIYEDSVNKVLKALKVKVDEEVVLQRLQAMIDIIKGNEQYTKIFGKYTVKLKTTNMDSEGVTSDDKLISTLLTTLTIQHIRTANYNLKLTKDLLPVTYVIIAGLHRLQKAQPSYNSRATETLRASMAQGVDVKVRYIIISKSLEELTEYRKVANFVLMSGYSADKMNKVVRGIETVDTPETVASVIDSVEGKQNKYIGSYISPGNKAS